MIFGDSDTGRHIIRIDNERAELLAPYYFADWVFADGLAAVYDPHDELIEAALEPVSKYTRFSIRTLLDTSEREQASTTAGDEFDDAIGDDPDKEEPKTKRKECIKFRSRSSSHEVELSSPTNRALLIPAYLPVPLSIRTKNRLPTLKIRNVRPSEGTPKEIANIVEAATNDIFVELDLAHGIFYRVARRTQSGRVPRNAERLDRFDPALVPRRSYSPEPSSLYFYARSSDGVPLLQYLAYYQVAEYFFPKFWQAEITHKIQNVLHDPKFSSDDERDIQRIIGIVGRNGGRQVGSELQALRHTIASCCDDNSIIAFLEGSEKGQHFFEKDRSIKAVRHINIKNKNEPLSSQVANRIYDLRCRIVHSKENGDVDKTEPLLPFSDEARRLSYDIDLVEYVAQKVLIATSTEF